MTTSNQAWPSWPVYGLVDDIVPFMLRCAADQERFALATVVKVVGSSPRRVGSEMLITARGEVYGYVSGGCIEAAVAEEARQCLDDGLPRMLVYGEGSPHIDIQLTCGGRIEVFVRCVEAGSQWLSCLASGRAGRYPVEVDTNLRTGAMVVAGEEWAPSMGYRCRYAPPTRLVLIGGDPVTLATAMLANHMGMEVVLWRHHGPAELPHQISVSTYLAGSLHEGLGSLKIDEFTAVYCLTHDLDLDVLALEQALPSPAFCVGVLGSRSKREARAQVLQARGVSRLSLSRLRSPAGIAIEAKTPHEIALSILAEVVSLSRSEVRCAIDHEASEPMRLAV